MQRAELAAREAAHDRLWAFSVPPGSCNTTANAWFSSAKWAHICNVTYPQPGYACPLSTDVGAAVTVFAALTAREPNGASTSSKAEQ